MLNLQTKLKMNKNELRRKNLKNLAMSRFEHYVEQKKSRRNPEYLILFI